MGNNTCHHIKLKSCGYSICHLTITSAITNNNNNNNDMWLFHLPLGNNISQYNMLQHNPSGITSSTKNMAITSANHKNKRIKSSDWPITSATFQKANNIYQAKTSANDTIRHNICLTIILKNKCQYYKEKHFPVHHLVLKNYV